MDDIANAERHKVTSPQFRIDREIEKRQIPNLVPQLKTDSDRPHVLWLQACLLSGELSLVPRGRVFARGSRPRT